MFLRTYLVVFGTKVTRAVVHGEPPLPSAGRLACGPLITCSIPNWGFCRLVALAGARAPGYAASVVWNVMSS
jgi:hypothetical protein